MIGNSWKPSANVKVALRDGMFFIAIWSLLLFGRGVNFFRDPGSFWHVAVGWHIHSFGLFDADPFTYTFHGEYWIPHQWLGEWLMDRAFRGGGFELLLLGATAILATIFFALGLRLFQVGIQPLFVVLFVSLGMAASAGQFHVRPHLATILGIFATITFLAEADAGRISVSRLAWLIPLCCVWANIHGGVLAGLAVIALMFSGWMVVGFFKLGPLTSLRDRAIGGGILIACFSATLANPFGWKIPAAWLKIYSMQSLPQVINEHMPLGLHTPGWQWIVLLAVVYAGVFFAISPRSWRLSFFVPFVLGVLTITRSRHAPLFAVSVLVLIAEMLPISKWSKRRNLIAPLAEQTFSVVSAVIHAILIVLVVFISGTMGYKDRLKLVWVELDRKAWPIEAMPAMQDAVSTFSHRRRPRVFCEYQFGSFLMLYEPRCLVHIDDRCELFGDEFLTDFANTRFELQTHRLEDPGSPLDRWQAKYGPMDLALVFTNGPFVSMFASRSADWKILHRDETATLFERVHPIK